MSKTILVIEDNKDNREILLEFLSAYGFDVVGAVDGKQGIDRYHSDQPDLVLCDVLLPKVNGFGVCQSIKEDENAVPVILMSALYKTHALQAEAKEKYGADEYILKPLNLVNLAKTICRLLDITKEDLEKAKESEKEPAGIPTEGSFSQFSAPLVLSEIFCKEKTGIMVCEGTAKKTVYFYEGVPIYITSDNPKETYGALMEADGLVTAEDRQAWETESQQSKVSLGNWLMTRKIITADQLTKYMLDEVHERLVDLITWFAGDFRFSLTDAFLKKIKRPPMAMSRSMYQGIKRGDFAGLISYRYIPFKNTIVNKIEQKLILVAELEMEGDDLETFALIDGEATLEQIIERTPQPLEDAYKVLFAMEMLGIITF